MLDLEKECNGARNILRDYLEDYVDGRAFWPEEVPQEPGGTDSRSVFHRDGWHAGK